MSNLTPLLHMFQPAWPTSDALKLLEGIAAPVYTVVTLVGAFSYLYNSILKSEVCVVSCVVDWHIFLW
jgi:hypothetical protein